MTPTDEQGRHTLFTFFKLGSLAFKAPPPSVLIPTAVVATPLSSASNSSTSDPGHTFRARGRSALDSASFQDVDRVDLTTLRSSETGG